MNLHPARLGLIILILSCNNNSQHPPAGDSQVTAVSNEVVDTLPQPFATKSVRNYSKVIGWPGGKTPVAPTGFKVEAYATGLVNPRNIYVADNGDVFVAQANTEVKGIKKVGATIIGATKSQRMGTSANSIILFRDENKDGIPDRQSIFLAGLNQPFGMLILNNYFYVANTDALWRYPYKPGDTVLTSKGEKILDLPAGGYNNHWTRNLLANKSKTRIYISVGSGSNIAEHGMANETRRANIIEINPDGSGEKIYASGLRNPVGMDWAPGTGVLWTAVNERDELGDELVPDYATGVKEGGFYGWPYSYFGQHPDPRMEKDPRPDMVGKAIVPDIPLGSHTASLGLAFYTGNTFPARYRGGMFIGQHGSWNRSELSGYKVVFIPFSNGKPAGKPEDFLTGFIANAGKQEVYGRPVSLAVLKDGSMLLADDAGNTLWRIVGR
ncbi:PQQ-dependent sugar dehydrogenase [Sediminibacterium ginsengisoli]|uniref:Glucose/arabinose dehydrogenase, beta-propeller fold n=1 Tax=Sediminibacterium ginsengisoli TaxID=413434 RepID=A0A1T4P7D3_9BACT|nr:sorbosone dehydrogenase family protein [Sediminibacterium ginsengisoli]SJZ87126.1 Glucose/arabinose dehydrogenase, beta-propeller fold [Sediminibacterium ginsengisoli]